jgi:hypothetical protein
VLAALGEEFANYAIYAPSDFDLLILASDAPLAREPQARVFESPGLAKELWTIHVLTAGDLDARYVGSRATLAPLFASYGMPANSDYYPVLDLNAAKSRFVDKSAGDLVALGTIGVPVLELLEPERPKRPPNPLGRGASSFERLEHTRLAWYARNYLVDARPPIPERVPRQLEKDLELVRLRLVDCRDAREQDVWLHSLLRVAEAVNPYLSWNDLAPLWGRLIGERCFGTLKDFQQAWLALFRAVAARDAPRMGVLATALLGTQSDLGNEARDYLLLAAMAGHLAAGDREAALAAWNAHGERGRAAASAPFRLLRCHARVSDCAAEFQAAR